MAAKTKRADRKTNKIKQDRGRMANIFNKAAEQSRETAEGVLAETQPTE